MIQRLRKEAGLSREGLAYKSGMSLRAIERIEAGTTSPRRATLTVIAQALKVEPEELREEKAA